MEELGEWAGCECHRKELVYWIFRDLNYIMGWNHELLVIASKQLLDGAGDETENNASCMKAASSLVSSQKFVASRLTGNHSSLQNTKLSAFTAVRRGDGIRFPVFCLSLHFN